MTACKPHNCGSERIAVLYDPQKKVCTVCCPSQARRRAPRSLTWLNIGGGSESIDGRTILYAALTAASRTTRTRSQVTPADWRPFTHQSPSLPERAGENRASRDHARRPCSSPARFGLHAAKVSDGR